MGRMVKGANPHEEEIASGDLKSDVPSRIANPTQSAVGWRQIAAFDL